MARENALVKEAPESLKSSDVTLWRSEMMMLMWQWDWFPWFLVSIRDNINAIILISHRDEEIRVLYAGICGNQWLTDHQIPKMNWMGGLLSYLLTNVGRKILALLGRDQSCITMGLSPGSGRYSGGENSSPLQYSFLENPMDRGAWGCKVHGVAKSQTWLRD